MYGQDKERRNLLRAGLIFQLIDSVHVARCTIFEFAPWRGMIKQAGGLELYNEDCQVEKSYFFLEFT